ncbi:MAG: hypothetical protein RLZZ361_424 [Cyanobacteriota bacterium]|jgi:hypothetical protein
MVNSLNSLKNNNRSSSLTTSVGGTRRNEVKPRGLSLRTNRLDQNTNDNKNDNNFSEIPQTPDQNNLVRSNENNEQKGKEAKDVSSPYATLAYNIFGATKLNVPKEMLQAKIKEEFKRLQNEGLIAAGWLEGSKQVGAIVKAGVDTIVGGATKIANLTKQGQG